MNDLNEKKQALAALQAFITASEVNAFHGDHHPSDSDMYICRQKALQLGLEVALWQIFDKPLSAICESVICDNVRSE